MSSISLKLLQAAAGQGGDPFAGDNSVNVNRASYYNFSAGTNFGTGDFTLEAWIRPDEIASFNSVVGQTFNSSGGILFVTSGQVQYYRGAAIVSGGSLSSNIWQHVAVSRESGTVRIFLDGNLVGTQTDTASITSDDVYVGASDSPDTIPSSESFDGEIYRPRISNAAKYTASFTPTVDYGVENDTLFLMIAFGLTVTEEAQGLPLSVYNSQNIQIGGSPP